VSTNFVTEQYLRPSASAKNSVNLDPWTDASAVRTSLPRTLMGELRAFHKAAISYRY